MMDTGQFNLGALFFLTFSGTFFIFRKIPLHLNNQLKDSRDYFVFCVNIASLIQQIFQI